MLKEKKNQILNNFKVFKTEFWKLTPNIIFDIVMPSKRQVDLFELNRLNVSEIIHHFILMKICLF